MKIGSLELTFHRTVRVAEGRQPSNLPPSLGRMELFRVSKYADKCPSNWEKEGFFVPLHDTEAMWMSFQSSEVPVAVLVGAGGVNALTGDKLGTSLEKDNYLVTPPQPWLDGWKDKDGTVYQFISTPYQKGKGNTVAEQLIGEESKTGALGIAVFEPVDRTKLKAKIPPREGWSTTAYDSDFDYPAAGNIGYTGGTLLAANCFSGELEKTTVVKHALAPTRSKGLGGASGQCVTQSFSEMGIGKGGKIIQKIYPDPYGLNVWKEKPEGTLAVYLVNAMVFEQITGIKIPVPVGHETYDGKWFGMNDKQEADVPGSSKFTGLKSAVFPASPLSEPAEKKKKVKKEKEQEVPVSK